MEIAKIISVYLLGTFKFLLGITGGYATGLSMPMTMIVTVGGMMTTVVIFTYFGHWAKKRVLSKFFRNRKTFTPRSRKWVKIWKKFGLAGVALFTPIFFMPLGGTLLAVSFEYNKQKIIVYMLVSAILWAIVLTLLFYEFGDLIRPYLE